MLLGACNPMVCPIHAVRPPASELAIYSTYVDVGGFLEGHDNFYQEDLDSTSLAGSLAGGQLRRCFWPFPCAQFSKLHAESHTGQRRPCAVLFLFHLSRMLIGA